MTVGKVMNCSVLRPALQNGEFRQGRGVALDHLFAGAAANRPGKKGSQFAQLWGASSPCPKARGRFHVEQFIQAVGDAVGRVGLQSHVHAVGRTQQLMATGILYPLGRSNSSAGPICFETRSVIS